MPYLQGWVQPWAEGQFLHLVCRASLFLSDTISYNNMLELECRWIGKLGAFSIICFFSIADRPWIHLSISLGQDPKIHEFYLRQTLTCKTLKTVYFLEKDCILRSGSLWAQLHHGHIYVISSVMGDWRSVGRVVVIQSVMDLIPVSSPGTWQSAHLLLTTTMQMTVGICMRGFKWGWI